MKKWLIGAVTVLVLAPGAFFFSELAGIFSKGTPEPVEWIERVPVKVGEAVPRFRAKDVNGNSYELQSTGPVRIVNFWASWCGPCLEELPSLLKMAANLKGKVEVILISEDKSGKPMREALKMYSVDAQANARWFMDSNKRISLAYGVEGLPESFIIAADGKLLRKVSGALTWTDPAIIDFLNVSK